MGRFWTESSSHPFIALADWLARPKGRRWILRGLLAIAVVGFFIWIRRPGDLWGYVLVGDLVLAGRHIYLDVSPLINAWPPFFSLLCVPLALLAAPTPYLVRGFWIVFNLGILLLVVHIIAKLVCGRGLSLRAEKTSLSLASPDLLIPVILTSRYLIGNFEHLQINILVFALALSGLYLLETKSELAGGVALGLGAAIKVMPAFFILYFAYRRRFRAAAYTTLATLAFSLSPILVFGWNRFWEYVAAWKATIAGGWGVGSMNQSVFAMWDRFIGHGIMPFTTSWVNNIRIDYVPKSNNPLVTVAVVASLAVVVVLALWIFRSQARQDSWARLAEWSIVFIVSAIFSPVCWKAYLVVLLLPNMLLFQAWRSPLLSEHARRVDLTHFNRQDTR